MTGCLHILNLEDSVNDAKLNEAMLSARWLDCRLIRVVDRALRRVAQRTERRQVEEVSVSGTFHFRRIIRYTKDASEREGVYFPVIVPKGATGTAEDFKLSLRLNELIATNYSVVTNAPVTVPESDAYSIVWVLASFPGAKSLNSNVSLEHEQKLLDGKFYYLPILEKAQPKPEGYEIHVNADRPIRSLTKAAGGVMVKGPRELVFVPIHLSLIAVTADLTKTAPQSTKD